VVIAGENGDVAAKDWQLFVSKLFVSQLFVSQLFVSQLFVSQLFVSQLFVSQLFVSQLFVATMRQENGDEEQLADERQAVGAVARWAGAKV
jgi:hypothetical protein